MRRYIKSLIVGITAFTCLSVHAGFGKDDYGDGIKQKTEITTTEMEKICNEKIQQYCPDCTGVFYVRNDGKNNKIDCKPNATIYPYAEPIFTLRKNMTYLQWIQFKIGNTVWIQPSPKVFTNFFDNSCLNNRLKDITGKKNILDNTMQVLISNEVRDYIADSLEHCGIDLSKQKYESDRKAIDAIKAIKRKPSND